MSVGYFECYGEKMKLSAGLGLSLLLCALAGCKPDSEPYFPGYAEADFIRIASPVTGTLARLAVQSGQQVKKGAPAFALEQDNERAARAEALFRLQRAQANLENLKKGRRPDEIAALKAQMAQAQAAHQLALADLARQSKLVSAHFIATARLDEANTALRKTQAQVSELQAQIRLAQLGARKDEIAAAENDSKAAQAQLAQADWKLAQKMQSVPADASVAEIYYREGELVPAGSAVLALLAPEHIKARFFVPQTQLGSLQLGQAVFLFCDACGALIPARITYISLSAEYTAPIIYSKENRAKLVYLLEARPAPQDAYKLHPGQPLEIRLSPK